MFSGPARAKFPIRLTFPEPLRQKNAKRDPSHPFFLDSAAKRKAQIRVFPPPSFLRSRPAQLIAPRRPRQKATMPKKPAESDRGSRMLRRSHKKSRNGCIGCKQRHIKVCSEPGLLPLRSCRPACLADCSFFFFLCLSHISICFSFLLRLLYLSPLAPGLHTTFPHSTYATEGVTLQHIGGIGIICIC